MKWKKIFAYRLSDRQLIFKIYKLLPQLDSRKTSNYQKWTKDLRNFSSKDIQIRKQVGEKRQGL